MGSQGGYSDYITVSELTGLIKGALESSFPRVRVGGEVSNFYKSSTGHQYFTLKDEQAQIRVALFRGKGEGITGKIEDGIFAIVSGAIAVYEKRGEYQVIAYGVEVGGIGALLLKFQMLKEKLQAEGLFDEERKKPLPFLPKRIGVATSIKGAAVRDIVRVIRNRFENLGILISPSAVQGGGAEVEIGKALNLLSRFGNVDLIIVGRGGGSIEDLWAFNEEHLVREIAGLATPVISAVGHETDFTLADFVADFRAATPSNAAEVAVPVKRELEEKLAHLLARVEGKMYERIEVLRGRLNHLKAELADPRVMLRSNKIRLADLEERLNALSPHVRLGALRIAVKSHIVEIERMAKDRALKLGARLENLKGRITSLDPKGILERGYSITYDEKTGSVLRDSDRAYEGAIIKTILFRGRLRSKVEGKE